MIDLAQTKAMQCFPYTSLEHHPQHNELASYAYDVDKDSSMVSAMNVVQDDMDGSSSTAFSYDSSKTAPTATPSGVVEQMKKLKPNFTPGPFDVICGRGKEARNHSGNRRFRKTIQNNIEAYSKAQGKLEKSVVISKIVKSVRAASPLGGFVKDIDGQYFEVGDHLSREKVGQSLRDMLDSQYKSSTKAKQRRRRVEINEEIEELVQSRPEVSRESAKLADTAAQHTASTSGTLPTAGSDEELLRLFTEVNIGVLAAIKRDTLLKKQAMYGSCCTRLGDDSFQCNMSL